MENFGRKEHYGKKSKVSLAYHFFSLHIFNIASGCSLDHLARSTVCNQKR